MPRTCSICSHKQRKAIDKSLAAGESYRNIAKRFETTPSALTRHVNSCGASKLQAAIEKTDRDVATEISDYFAEAIQELADIAKEARAASDFRSAVTAIQERTTTVLHKWQLLAGRSSSKTSETPLIAIEPIQTEKKPGDEKSELLSLRNQDSSNLRPV